MLMNKLEVTFLSVAKHYTTLHMYISTWKLNEINILELLTITSYYIYVRGYNNVSCLTVSED